MKRTRGFTIIELMISLVMVGIVMTGALRIFRSISGAVRTTVDRMDAMQNLRFGMGTIDQDLRNAGAGTTEIQPTLVYISPTEVTFNADLVSIVANSPTAVFYNPDADANLSNAVTTAQQFTIPTTVVQYPDSTYRSAGALSPAETETLWFELDTSTARTDDYHLMRKVNNGAPDEVARNLLPFPGRPFLEWLRTDSIGNLSVVASAALPWRHTNPVHGSLTDTGTVSRIDSIRAVRVSAYATNGLTGAQQIIRQLVTTVRIPNAGLTKQRSCGDVPIFNGTVAAVSTGVVGAPNIRLTWTPAVDETTGEQDVERYLIYRRTAAGTFDDALAIIPAGQASYTYNDGAVFEDSTYYYGVTALDCTPLESSMRTSAAVLVP